jgi:hypothetical protein
MAFSFFCFLKNFFIMKKRKEIKMTNFRMLKYGHVVLKY